jgi:hypothetical protein
VRRFCFFCAASISRMPWSLATSRSSIAFFAALALAADFAQFRQLGRKFLRIGQGRQKVHQGLNRLRHSNNLLCGLWARQIAFACPLLQSAAGQISEAFGLPRPLYAPSCHEGRRRRVRRLRGVLNRLRCCALNPTLTHLCADTPRPTGNEYGPSADASPGASLHSPGFPKGYHR